MKGTWLGAQGGECWRSVSLEGGWGYLYSTPRPWQPTQGLLPQQRQGQLPAPGVCLEVGLCHGGWGSENIRGKKKRRHLLTTFYTGSQSFKKSFFLSFLLTTVPLLMPMRDF